MSTPLVISSASYLLLQRWTHLYHSPHFTLTLRASSATTADSSSLHDSHLTQTMAIDWKTQESYARLLAAVVAASDNNVNRAPPIATTKRQS